MREKSPSVYGPHGNFHNPPEVAHDAPAYSVISTTVDGSYHNVGIVCHSCDSWPGNSLSVTSEKQAWVFANNYDWLMQTDDPTKPLTLHTFYDQFHLNMKLIHSDVESLGPWELIDNARTSVLGPGETSSSTSSRRPSPYVIHGALLSLAFMALMPAATISVAAATSGIGLGAYSSQLLIEVPSARGSHQITGLLILASLLAAPSLGYLHHVRFLKLGHRTAFTEWHRRTGYTTIASGWANVLLGLYVAGRSTWWSAAVTSWCVILVCCISMIPKYVNSGRLRQSYVKLEQVSE
ncbi:hypothetical protein Cob_v002701 [Colletotrichum orbiculare MAFF 240422]|uniref:Cellobiose dehydrogenase-like cytochrome domain-containing protein n=1 Tax=Colletotrichum orbiculare (strain 104-T / ATCC 96160 / CBS 514.97 / LARS 414 / MAFF 240422) TaxID=1213857 RepID=A0A484G1Y3_COLOR|nr:hypothetical protein Cob_v002701 [Colletotrichum orbiculare MAFF 240422]